MIGLRRTPLPVVVTKDFSVAHSVRSRNNSLVSGMGEKLLCRRSFDMASASQAAASAGWPSQTAGCTIRGNTACKMREFTGLNMFLLILTLERVLKVAV